MFCRKKNYRKNFASQSIHIIQQKTSFVVKLEQILSDWEPNMQKQTTSNTKKYPQGSQNWIP